MRRLQILNSFLIAGTFFIVSSCDPIYIPDPIDPRLPKYTEQGNRVAGAFINGKLWKSKHESGGVWGYDSDLPRIDYYSFRDSISLSFSGNLEESSVSIMFGLKGFAITSLSGMTKLKGSIIEFDGVKSSATLYRYGFEDCITQPVGQIYFRNVIYNLESDNIIISGTFGFTYDDPICGKIAVTYGRFDYEINNF